jgi:hypothetical protein
VVGVVPVEDHAFRSQEVERRGGRPRVAIAADVSQRKALRHDDDSFTTATAHFGTFQAIFATALESAKVPYFAGFSAVFQDRSDAFFIPPDCRGASAGHPGEPTPGHVAEALPVTARFPARPGSTEVQGFRCSLTFQTGRFIILPAWGASLRMAPGGPKRVSAGVRRFAHAASPC